MFRFDDAMRGWGYLPMYELAVDGVYRLLQQGYRAVPHYDRERYYALARKLEVEATAALTRSRLAEMEARVEAAEVVGRVRGNPKRPAPRSSRASLRACPVATICVSAGRPRRTRNAAALAEALRRKS